MATQLRPIPTSAIDAGSGMFVGGVPSSGEHTIASRAIDVDGNVQPSPDDPSIATKVTYWESNGQITRRILIP